MDGEVYDHAFADLTESSSCSNAAVGCFPSWVGTAPPAGNCTGESFPGVPDSR